MPAHGASACTPRSRASSPCWRGTASARPQASETLRKRAAALLDAACTCRHARVALLNAACTCRLARAADEELPAAFLDEPQEPEREAAEAEREDFLTLAAASLTSSAPAEAEPAEAEPGAAGASQPAEQSESG